MLSLWLVLVQSLPDWDRPHWLHPQLLPILAVVSLVEVALAQKPNAQEAL